MQIPADLMSQRAAVAQFTRLVHGQNRDPAPCGLPHALSAPQPAGLAFALQVLACQQLGERPCLAAESPELQNTWGQRSLVALQGAKMRLFPAVGTEPGQGVGLEQFLNPGRG